MTTPTRTEFEAAALPPLPKKRRAFYCTKCGSQECVAGCEDQKHPECAKCKYLGFGEDSDYNDAEMQAYARLAIAAAMGWGAVPEQTWPNLEECPADGSNPNPPECDPRC